MIGKLNFKINPRDTGLYSNVSLGPSFFRNKSPSDLQKGWDILYESLEKTFLKKVKTPFAVYFSVGSISYFDSEHAILSDLDKKIIDKHGLKIYLLEPLSTYKKDKKDKIYVEYKLDEIEEIYSFELDSIQKYVNRNNIINAEVYSPSYKIDVYFQNKYPELKLMCTPIGWIYPSTIKIDTNICYSDTINKKFWCGNWRYASHRHMIASYLTASVDANNYNLSYIHESNKQVLKDNLWFDIESLNIDIKNTLELGSDILGNLSPMSMQTKLDKQLKVFESINLHIDTNPAKHYRESFCSIITETRFAEMTCLLTEKTLNAIINMRPFIMVGPPGNLEYLKKYGIKTFSNWFDESYDLELCHVKRIEKIFSLIDYINNKDINQLRKIYDDMFDVLLYNQYRILELQEEFLKTTIDKNKLFKKIRYAS